MANEVTGSDRLIALGLRARAALERIRYYVPGGQMRDHCGVAWVKSDEADWNAGGSGHQVPDMSDQVTAAALFVIARHRLKVLSFSVLAFRPEASIIVVCPDGVTHEFKGEGVEAFVVMLEAATS